MGFLGIFCFDFCGNRLEMRCDAMGYLDLVFGRSFACSLGLASMGLLLLSLFASLLTIFFNLIPVREHSKDRYNTDNHTFNLR